MKSIIELIDKSEAIDIASKNRRYKCNQLSMTAESGLRLSFPDASEPMNLEGDAEDGLMALLKAGLTTLPPTALAECANIIFAHTKMGVRLRTYKDEAEHLIAVNSGEFREIHATAFLRQAVESLEADYGELIYVAGAATPTDRLLTVELPNMKAGLERELEAVGLHGPNAVPMVEILTSDSGKSAAQFQPLVKWNEGCCPVPFCRPLGARHRGRGDWVSQIQDAESGILAAFHRSAEQMAHLASIELRNPADATANVCRRVQLPLKVARDAIDEIRIKSITSPDEPVTALDCYLTLAEVFSEPLEEGKGMSALQLRNNLARVIFADWAECDAEADGRNGRR